MKLNKVEVMDLVTDAIPKRFPQPFGPGSLWQNLLLLSKR